MLVTTLEADPYLGRMLTGRIDSRHGRRPTWRSRRCRATARSSKRGRITKILAFRGLERVPADEAEAGDIVAMAGLTTTTVADTICAIEVETPLPAQPIDPPTLAMTFSVNDSPLAGREGDKVHQPRDPRRACCAKPKAMSRSRSPKPSDAMPSKWPAAANCSWAC